MGPTEILLDQHFKFAKNLFKNLNIKIEFLSPKKQIKKRKKF